MTKKTFSKILLLALALELYQPAAWAADYSDSSYDDSQVPQDNAEQQLWIRTTFQKGKRLYDQNDFRSAEKEWDKLTPYLGDNLSLKKVIDFLKGQAKEKPGARKRTPALKKPEPAATPPDLYSTPSESPGSRSAAAPEDLRETLGQANDRLKAEIYEREIARSQSQKNAIGDAETVNAIYQKGKRLFDAGRLPEAVREWESILPYLPEGSEERRLFMTLKQNYAASLASPGASTEKPTAPPELRRMLQEAVQRLESEAERAKSQRLSSQENQQGVVDTLFERGKRQYQSGDVESAIETWNEMAPYLENGPEIELLLRDLSQGHKRIQKNSREIAQTEGEKFSISKDMRIFFNKASSKLRTEETELAARKADAEKVLSRQQQAEELASQGKLLYYRGQVGEAIEVWQKILPHLDPNSEDAALIESLSENYAKVTQVREGADRTAGQLKIIAPAELRETLAEANQKIESNLNEFQRRSQGVKKSFSERQAWVDRVFGEGKELYANGKTTEAFQRWRTLTPYLDDAAEVERALDAAEQSQRELASQGALPAEGRFKAPEELTFMLSQLNEVMQRDIAMTRLERQEMEKSLSDRQAWVAATYEKGEALYKQNKFDEAMAEWTKLLPFVEGASGVQKMMDAARENHAAALEAKQAVSELAASEYKSLKLPRNRQMMQTLTEANEGLKLQIQETLAQKKDLEGDITKQQNKLLTLFEKGEDFYRQGRYDDAIESWKKMLPYVREDSELAGFVRAMEKDYQGFVDAQKSLEAASKNGTRVEAPPALRKTLEDVARDLKAREERSRGESSKTSQQAEERRAWVETTFEKGRAFYSQGNIPQALEVWEQITPYLTDGSEIRSMIEGARADQEQVAAAQMSAEQTLQKQAAFKSPEGLSPLLKQMSRGLETQAEELQAQKSKAEADYRQTGEWVETTFSKGKAFYDAKRYRDALETWKKLMPYLQQGSDAQRLLQEAETKHQAFLKNSLGAEEVVSRSKQKFKLDPLAGLLQKTAEALETETLDAQTQRQQMEKSLAERQARVEGAYQKGRTLFQQNRFQEAITEWERLLPDMENAAELQKAMQAAKESHTRATQAKKSAAEFAANEYKGLKLPYNAEMREMLNQAGTRLADDIEQSQNQRKDMEKTLADRENWVAATFAKGKAFHAQGRYREALEIWDTITPYVLDGSALKQAIDVLRNIEETGVLEKQAAEKALAQQDKRFASPAEMKDLLGKMSTELKARADSANQQRTQAEKTLAERQAWVDATFQKGRQLYLQDNVEGALELWRTLVPYLEDAAQMKTFIQDAADSQRASMQAKDAAAKAASKKDSPLPSPQELGKLLQSVDQRLRAEATQAQTERQQIEKSLAERQTWVESNFQKGKELYSQGDVAGALEAWERVVPYVDEGSNIKPFIESASQSYKAALAAQQSAEKALSQKDKGFVSPADMKELLGKMSAEMKARAQSAQEQRSQAEKTVADRQAWITATYERGKELYAQGNVQGALELWNTLAPYLEDSSQIKANLQSASENYKASAQAKDAAAKAMAQQDTRFPSPPDLARILQSADQRLKNEAAEAVSERQKMEITLAERKVWITAVYEKGQVLYKEGKVDEALGEWEKLGPYLDEKSGVRELIAGVQETQQAALDAKKGVTQFAANEFKKVKVPYAPAMTQFLNEANSKLKADSEESARQKLEMERTLAERRAWIAATYEKGKQLYDQGQYDKAASLWKTLTPYLERDAEVAALIDKVSQNYSGAASSRRSAETAAFKAGLPVPAPEGLLAALQEAGKKLDIDTREAEEKKSQADKILTERRARVQAEFQKGKELYGQGKIKEALEAWNNLPPYLENSQEIKDFLQRLEKKQKDFLSVRNEANLAVSNRDTRFDAPDELAVSLQDMDKQLQAKIASFEAQRAKAEKSLADRQAWVEGNFKKGKDLYSQGDLAGAVGAWEILAPYLDESSNVKPLIESASQTHKAALAAQQSAEKALAQKDMRFAPPAEMKDLLVKLTADLKTRTEAAQAQRSQAEKSLADRQAWMNVTFQKGKELYSQGNIQAAIEIWNTLAPYLEDSSQIKATLQSVSENYKVSVQAKDSATKALAQKDMRFPSPPDLTKILQSADQRLKNETAEAVAERQKMEKTLAERQAWIAATYEKGQTLYKEGNVDEALREWEKLGPYLDEKSGVRELISSVQETQQAALEAKEAAVQAVTNEYKGLRMPANFEAALGQTNDRLKQETQKYLAQRADAEKALVENQNTVTAAYEKGKAHLEQGQWWEASEAWQGLTPYVDEGMKKQLDQLRQNADDAEKARRDKDEFAAKEYSTSLKLPYGEEMTRLLTESQKKMLADTQAARDEKARMQKMLSDRQSSVTATFQKGKDLYDQGRVQEALDVWDSITPNLDNQPRIKEHILGARQSYEASQAAAAELEAVKARPVMAPAALPETLKIADERLKKEALEAQTETAKADKALGERRDWVVANFQKGKAFYDQGLYKEAMDAWAPLLPQVENRDKLQVLMDNVSDSYRRSLESREAMKVAQARINARVVPSEDFTKLLTQADERLKKELGGVQAERDKTEKAVADRQAWVESNVQRGQELYGQNKVREALEVWQTVLPYLPQDSDASDRLQSAREAYEGWGRASEAAQQAKNRAKLKAPEEFYTVLDEINGRFRKEGMDAETQRVGAERSLAERQSLVNSTFEKGKIYYDTGNYGRAIEIWAAMLPYLEESPQLETEIKIFRENLAQTESAKKTAQEAISKQNLRLKAPADMASLLIEANERLKNEVFEAQGQKTKVEQNAVERQAWMNAAFQRGLESYNQGRLGEAIDEWGKLSPYLEDQSSMQKLIETVRKTNLEALEAKKSAVEAVASEYQGLKLSYSDQMVKLLQDANSKLISEISSQRSKRDQVERTLAERKEWTTTTFNKGRVLYEEGRYGEAIAQWGRLAPYLEEGSHLSNLIESFKKNYELSETAKSSVSESEGREKAPPVNAAAMTAYLEEANKKIKSQAEEGQSRVQTLDKKSSEKLEWINYVYEKGKKLADEGNMQQAVAEWDVLMPHLEAYPRIRELIDQAKKELARKSEPPPTAPEPAEPPPAEEISVPSQVTSAPAKIEEEPPAEEPAAEETAPAEEEPTEMPADVPFELISGEVQKIDESGKTLTIKLHAPSKEKALTVNYDDTTQVNGSQTHQTLASLQTGAEVDLRYDPKSSRAVYIYIY